jgi:hypothetical protein
LANKINKNIDYLRLPAGDKSKVDNVYSLSLALYQELTQKTHVSSDALSLANKLAIQLESLYKK